MTVLKKGSYSLLFRSSLHESQARHRIGDYNSKPNINTSQMAVDVLSIHYIIAKAEQVLWSLKTHLLGAINA